MFNIEKGLGTEIDNKIPMPKAHKNAILLSLSF